MSFARTRTLVIGCLAAAILALPGVAFAYNETTSTIPARIEANRNRSKRENRRSRRIHSRHIQV
jgi:hypothetical protein